MEQTNDILWVAGRLLGSLALLIFGMKMMSETLQKKGDAYTEGRKQDGTGLCFEFTLKM